MAQLCDTSGDMPAWFRKGVEYAMLAPTAMNQQKFYIEHSGNTAHAKALSGMYTDVDLGIVKYHFEAASGRKIWK